MTFPASPTAGVTTHTTAGGVTYIYNSKGAWQVQAGGGGGSSVTLTRSSTAPTGQLLGHHWFDTDRDMIFTLAGTSPDTWVEITDTAGGGGGVTLTRSTTAPTGKSLGHLWYDTDNDAIYALTATSPDTWVDITDSGGGGGSSLTQSASAPTGKSPGHFWFDTNDDTIYILTSTSPDTWVDITVTGALGMTAMTGATSTVAGTSGAVPAPAAGDQAKFLRGDGTWAAASSGLSSFVGGVFGVGSIVWGIVPPSSTGVVGSIEAMTAAKSLVVRTDTGGATGSSMHTVNYGSWIHLGSLPMSAAADNNDYRLFQRVA